MRPTFHELIELDTQSARHASVLGHVPDLVQDVDIFRDTRIALTLGFTSVTEPVV